MRKTTDRHWLDMAEYVSLVGSVAGTVAAVAFQQIIYVTAPLTLALSLSLANRQRFQQQIQQQAVAAIANVSQVVPSLQMAEVQCYVGNLQEHAAASMASIRQELSEEIESFRVLVQSRLMALEAIDLSLVERTIAQIQTDLQALANEVDQDLKPLLLQIHQIRQQMRELPPPFDSSLFEQRVADIEQINFTFETHLKRLFLSVKELESGTAPMESAIAQLKNQLDTLVQQFDARLEPQQISELREAHTNLIERLDQLPSPLNSFDPLLIKTEIEALKTETQNLSQAVQNLAPRTEVAKQLDSLRHKIKSLPTLPASVDLSGVQAAIAVVEARLVTLEVLNLEPIYTNISYLQESLEEITHRLDSLPPSAKVKSLDGAVIQLQTEIQDLDQRQKDLDDQQRIFQTQLDGSVNNVTSLQGQVERLAATFGSLGSKIEDQVQEAVLRYAEEINQRLQEIRPYDYQLVINCNESRNILLEALEEAQEHLIIVCPWLTRSSIDDEVIWNFRAILNRNGQIDIGWGHLSNTELSQQTQITRQELLYTVSQNNQEWQYGALPYLEQLEQEYRGRFRLKLLGMHENYLVCDRSFAMLGSHNFLTCSTSSSEREVGLRTNDPRIIEDLISQFTSAKNLDNLALGVFY